MIDSIGEDAEGERLRFPHGIVLGVAVGEGAGELDDIRNPTPVEFAFAFDGERHGHDRTMPAFAEEL